MVRYLNEEGNITDDAMHHEDEPHSSMNKPWGEAIGAALIVQMVTLSGVVFVAISVLYRKYSANKGEETSSRYTDTMFLIQHTLVPSFAVGALLATSVFLIIPEALLLLQGHLAAHDEHQSIEEDHETEHVDETHDHGRLLGWMIVRRLLEVNETSSEHAEEEKHQEGASESEVAWKFGAAFLGGFIFPFVIGSLFPHAHLSSSVEADEEDEKENEIDCDKEQEMTTDNDEEKVQAASIGTKEITATTDELDEKTPSTNIPLVVQTRNVQLQASIIVGDFFHNLADGFFIGTAFLLCSNSIAWTIVASTIYHEIAQEIADFFLLTTHCGLSIVRALFVNFCSGLSVMIGVIIVFSVNLQEATIGAILSVSAGVYVYIAVAECAPRVQTVIRNTAESVKRTYHSILFLTFFVLGAVPIGLVLLNHEHCEAAH